MNQSAGAAQNVRRRSSTSAKDLGDIGGDKNWKGIAISLLVIIIVLSLIGLAIVLLSKDDGSGSLGSQLTLDDLFQKSFQVYSPDAVWFNEEELILRNSDGDVLRVNTQSNDTDLLLKNTTFATFKASKFSVSPDLNFVLLGYDVKPVFRQSFLASYLIYNLHTREVRELNPPEVSDSVLQFASWGVRGQQLVYVFENNIYYQADVTSSSWRLTSSGQEGVIFNGISDWLYEEEVLRSPLAHWWSPEGSRLAYLCINDTLVPNMVLPRFTGSLYPRGQQYPYPKMGQVNPTVKIYIVTMDGSSQTTELRPPNSLERSEYYITMVTWVTEERVAVRWVNRAQNTSILSLCDVTTGDCAKKHVMTSEKWLDSQNEEPVFSDDGMTFFLTVPIKHGGQGSFRHIAMMSEQVKGQEVNMRHLTSGSWDVTRVLGYDDTSNAVYFLSTEDGSAQRHLYRVSSVDPFHRECLTCFLFEPQCSFYDALLSPDYQHVVLNCRGPGIPQTTLHNLNNMSIKLASLEVNQALRDALVSRNVPRREIRILQLNRFALPLELTLPADFDETTQHPLLLILDGSPGGQSVSDRYQLDWDSVLVSSDSVIVARLDGRGSGFLGQRILHEVHQRLGTVEVQDQIAAVEYMMKFPYIDRTRIAVFGRGYGGYITLMMLKATDQLFKCAVAMSPVTDWKLYASAFSERYLGVPLRDDSRYQFSSVLQNVQSLREQTLMLVHGTADANVHFQHTAELIKNLVKVGANYSMQMYPDEGHFLSQRSRQHLSATLTSFFRACLQEEFLPEEEEEEEEEE